MNTLAVWIGYIVMGLAAAFVAWEMFAWLMCPVWRLAAELRMIAHRDGWREAVRWRIVRRIPGAYVSNLRRYWSLLGGYGEGTVTWDCATWHRSMHPFDPGRMVFWDRPTVSPEDAP